jgi:hypothetical protein
MANERVTEDIVRNHFKNDPLFKSIKFEEQKSYNKRVIELLQNASKSGKGIGKPEFIISFPAGNIDYLLVIECKASVINHQSLNLNNSKDFAVDGVLHYAKSLSTEFDVVAIAVSGQTEQELLVSHFIWEKGEEKPTENKADKKLLSINDYLKLFNNEQFADNLRNVDIIQKAIYLNEEYQAYSITEMTRCTMARTDTPQVVLVAKRYCAQLTVLRNCGRRVSRMATLYPSPTNAQSRPSHYLQAARARWTTN